MTHEKPSNQPHDPRPITVSQLTPDARNPAHDQFIEEGFTYQRLGPDARWDVILVPRARVRKVVKIGSDRAWQRIKESGIDSPSAIPSRKVLETRSSL